MQLRQRGAPTLANATPYLNPPEPTRHHARARTHTAQSALPRHVGAARLIAPELPRRPRVISESEVKAAKKLVGASKVLRHLLLP